MANERGKAANEDILAVLACLVTPQAHCFDVEALDAFGLDHAHHPDRLPQLLRELAA